MGFRLYRPTSSEKGASIIEIMIGASIATIVGLGMSFLLKAVSDYFVIISEQYSALTSLASTTYQLQTIFSHAIDVERTANTTTDVPTTIAADTAGVVRFDYTFNSGTPATATTTLLGLFLREQSPSLANSPGVSLPVATGLYFTTPTQPVSAVNRGTTGVLWVDLGDYNAGGGNDTVGPGPEDLFFDRIVEFVMEPETESATDNRVRTIKFTIVVRYFLKNDRSGWNWCPTADLPSGSGTCPAMGTGFQDLQREVTVTLRNSPIEDIDTNPTSHARLLGNIYFFNFISPTRYFE